MPHPYHLVTPSIWPLCGAASAMLIAAGIILVARFNNYKLYFNPNAPFQRNQVVAGIQVTVPIFSAKTRANISLAKSQLEESEINLSEKRQQVSLEVRQKSRDVREMNADREVARLDLKLAQQNLELLQARLESADVVRGRVAGFREGLRIDLRNELAFFPRRAFIHPQTLELSLHQRTGNVIVAMNDPWRP